MEKRWIEPIDTLFLRGNRLFGGGDHAAALMPPWPSMLAGALRSRMLADAGITDFNALAEGSLSLGPLEPILGFPGEPGSFELVGFFVARQTTRDTIEPLWPLPADLVVRQLESGLDARMLEPIALPTGVQVGPGGHDLLPRLRATQPAKPRANLWLTRDGIVNYLAGQAPRGQHLISSEEIWTLDHRLGIALDATTRSTVSGALYTTDAIVMRPGHGFAAVVAGADGALPSDGLVRLGGDGRGARIAQAALEWPEPDYATLAQSGRMRLVLTSPGLFASGSALPGIDEEGRWHGPNGISARLRATAVGAAQTVSGWDLARRRPKNALRAVPAGAVYWLDSLDADETALRKLAAGALPLPEGHDDRRPEGFNRFTLAAWPTQA